MRLVEARWTPSLEGILRAPGCSARVLLRRFSKGDRRTLLRALRPARHHYGRPGYVMRVGKSHDRGLWVRVTFKDEPLPDGGVAITVAVQEVTEQQRREEQLHRELRRQDQMADIAGIGTWTLDLVTNELVWSPRVFEIHEMEPGPTPSVAEAVALL